MNKEDSLNTYTLGCLQRVVCTPPTLKMQLFPSIKQETKFGHGVKVKHQHVDRHMKHLNLS